MQGEGAGAGETLNQPIFWTILLIFSRVKARSIRSARSATWSVLKMFAK
jgi:hypothetical protein